MKYQIKPVSTDYLATATIAFITGFIYFGVGIKSTYLWVIFSLIAITFAVSLVRLMYPRTVEINSGELRYKSLFSRFKIKLSEIKSIHEGNLYSGPGISTGGFFAKQAIGLKLELAEKEYRINDIRGITKQEEFLKELEIASKIKVKKAEA